MIEPSWRLAALVVVLSLSACGSPVTPTVTDSPSLPQPDATPIPSAEPTPIPEVVLVVEESADWEDALAEWAANNGWQLSKSDPSGAAAYLSESTAPVAVVSIGERLSGALESAAADGVAVVAVNVPGLEAGQSLSVVVGPRFDQAGFLAGVMTGLASETGQVGLITATGGVNETDYRAGFSQGLLWGCPKCQVVDQTAPEMTLDRFRANLVDVVFAVPGPEAAGAGSRLADGGFPMVWAGDEGPPTEAVVGRIVFDEGSLIVHALEQLTATGDGHVWAPSIETGSITVVDINEEFLSIGRQRLLSKVYDAIAVGDLDIGTSLEP